MDKLETMEPVAMAVVLVEATAKAVLVTHPPVLVAVEWVGIHPAAHLLIRLNALAENTVLLLAAEDIVVQMTMVVLAAAAVPYVVAAAAVATLAAVAVKAANGAPVAVAVDHSTLVPIKVLNPVLDMGKELLISI